MEDTKFAILLGLGDENQKVIHCYEKDYKIYVDKEFDEEHPEVFAFNFYHISDDAKKLISEDEVEQWMTEKKLTVKDCEAVASWYVLEREKLPELRYAFPALQLEVGDPHLCGWDADGTFHDYR